MKFSKLDEHSLHSQVLANLINSMAKFTDLGKKNMVSGKNLTSDLLMWKIVCYIYNTGFIYPKNRPYSSANVGQLTFIK